MSRRFWSWLLAPALVLPGAAALAVLEGCSSGAEIIEQEPVKQPTGDRQEQRRDRRLRDLERKEYDG